MMKPVMQQVARTAGRAFRVLPLELPLLLAVSCSDGGSGPPTVATVVVTAPSPSVAVYRTLQLTATLRDRNGNAMPGSAVTWSSSSEAVATVDASGLVTGVSAGTVVITATSLGRSGTLSLEVAQAAVDTVRVSPDTATLVQGGTSALTVTLKDERGVTLTGRTVVWTSDSAIVASVSPSGVVTGMNAGSARITATVEGKSGNATVSVRDTVATVAISPPSATIDEGGTTTLNALVYNASGARLVDRAAAWTTSDVAIATVSDAGVVTPVAAGTVTITATVEGKSGSASVTVRDTVAGGPAITAIAPATLTPGATATITGGQFSTTASNNVVTIGGTAAVVTSATSTQLQVTVPCVPSGSVAVVVTVGGVATAPYAQPLQVTSRHSLAVGQSAVITDGTRIACNELAATGVQSRYVLAVYNTTASPTAMTDYQLSGTAGGTGGADVVTYDGVSSPRTAARRWNARRPAEAAQFGVAAQSHDDAHYRLLEKNQQAYRQLWQQYGRSLQARERASADAAQLAAVEPPLTKTIRVSDIDASSICTNYFTITATRIYYSGRLAIYEDDATPAELKAANNAAMAAYYQQIGDQFNADMEPIIRSNFGDVLRRDAVTDNNGVLMAVFTPVVNNEFNNLAGFVVSCDQFPNGTSNTASNFGEYFYAYLPTVAGTGYSSFTPDAWYRSIRSTFIHETKHVASFAARMANGAPVWEESWLEEGTARHSEELWGRQSVYGVAWKGNTGYGSATDPNSIYCDVRPTTTSCNNASARRPALAMWRHFSTLYGFLGNSSALSPFGRTASDDAAYFYATSWSLVRYAIDRHATAEASFLTALNQSTTSGTTNLSDRAGVGIEELLGRWALALYADDLAGLGEIAELQLPSWNVPHIYAGLKTDYPSTYTRAKPLVTTSLALGTIAPVNYTALVGGGIDYFELSGVHTAAQVVRVLSTAGGAPPGALRIAILRVQ